MNRALLFFVFSLCLITYFCSFDLKAELQARPQQRVSEITAEGMNAWHLGDFVTAIERLHQAHELGDIDATTALAKLLHYSSEYEQALPLLIKASEFKEKEAMLILVSYYEKGFALKSKNPLKAKGVLEELIKLNYKPAILMQAEAIEFARLGYKGNTAKAHQIVLALAETDFIPAIQKMYAAYQKGGLGLEPDKEIAKSWKVRLLTALNSKEKNSKGGI